MKRKPRKMPKEHQELDLASPLDFSKIGTDKDPCFGKGYSMKAEECKRCGDCQVCAIVTQQLMHKEVAIEEKTGKFKDLQEADLVDSQNKKFASIMRKRAEKKPGVWLSFEKLLPKFRELTNLLPEENEALLQRAIKAAQETKLTINKSKTKYKI